LYIDPSGNNVGIGTSSPNYILDVKAISSIEQTEHGGGGTDDMVAGGTFTGVIALNYKVEINSTGTPDTFNWSDDDGSTWDAIGVNITGSEQALNNGVTVTFGATTGHTVGEYWRFTTTVTNPFSVQNAAGVQSMYVGNDGRVYLNVSGTGAEYALEIVGDIWLNADTIKMGNGTFYNKVQKNAKLSTEDFRIIIDENNDETNRYFSIEKDERKNKAQGTGTELMRVQENGNVGIATASPTEILDVNGRVRVRTLDAGSASDTIVVADSTGVLFDSEKTLDDLIDHDWYEVGTTDPPDDIDDNIFTNGNVGIGINNPGSYKLNVAGSVYAYTVNTGQGNYELYAMDQDVQTTDGVTFATVDTGQGANELYAMDQDVQTTDGVTFATVDTGQGANELYAMNQDVQTTDSVTFATVDTGQGANELYAMNQDVQTTDTVEFDEMGIGASALAGTKLYVSQGGGVGTYCGIKSEASGSGGANVGFGVYGTSTHSNEAVGVYGRGIGAGTNYGVYGIASGGTANWAGYFIGKVYCENEVGIGTKAPDGILEINMGTDKQFRLSYDDADGSATDYAKFEIADDGMLTLTTVDADATEADISLMPDGYVGIGTNSPNSALEVASGRLQVTGVTAPSGGTGVELGHDGTEGILCSYDRTTPAYKAMRYNALSHEFEVSGASYTMKIDTSHVQVDYYLNLVPTSNGPNPANEGDMYYDLEDSMLKVWDGSSWQDCY
jgi:hypothetical protein